MLGHSWSQQVSDNSSTSRFKSAGTLLLVLAALLFVAQSADAQSGGQRGPRRSDGEQPAEPDQQRAARSLFDAGTIAFRQLRYEDALESFSQAYKLTKDPVLLFSIGMAYDRLYRLPEAVQAFESYLEAMPNAPNRPAAEERIRVIREHIEEGDPNRNASQVAQPAPAPAPAPAPLPEPTQPVAEPRDNDPGARVIPPWGFWIGVGITGALAGTTIWASMDAVNAHDRYMADRTSTKNRKLGQDSEHRANVLIGVTAGAAVATAAIGIFFTDWQGKRHSASARATQRTWSAWLDGTSSGLLLSQPF